MNMRLYLSVIIWLSAALSIATGQQKQYNSSTDSDPEAVAVLDKVEDYLEEIERLKATFTLTLDMPGEEPMIYPGTLEQEGEKFLIITDEYIITSDGTKRWVYIPAVNEANIYNAEEEDIPSTLLDYLQFYRSEDFVFRSAKEYALPGELVVECKPLDDMSDYVKIRLTVDERTSRPLRIELFEKGGVKTDMQIDTIEEVSNFPYGHFVFDKEKYPGVRVEDLRID